MRCGYHGEGDAVKEHCYFPSVVYVKGSLHCAIQVSNKKMLITFLHAYQL